MTFIPVFILSVVVMVLVVYVLGDHDPPDLPAS